MLSLLLLCFLALSHGQGVSPANGPQTVAAWIHGSGEIVTGGDIANCTRLSAGSYCFQLNDQSGSIFNYAPVYASLQSGGRQNNVPLFVQTNDGAGGPNGCDSYLSIQIFDATGKPTDNDFSLFVLLPPKGSVTKKRLGQK